MASLIRKDPHISDTVNNMTFDLRYDLISALVERWHPETHTFHLPCGECTITLEDVALHFGLPIDGSAVTGVSAIVEPAALCYSLLGASPDNNESNFSDLKFTWLKANFEHLSVNATEEELMCAARAYIMHIIGGVLMPNANNNRVHLQYLPLLADLCNVHLYSWGSAVLAILYRELCRTTKPDVVDIGRCLVLLQSWALYRMPFLASVSHQPYVFPLVNRWSIYPGIWRLYTILIYRLMTEQHAGEGSSGTTGIEYYDSLVASSIYRIRRCMWERFTASTREENMEAIKGLCTENILRCGIIRWLEDLRWICLPICNHR
ncbi:protein MAIN-LIKE 1-like [Gossypium hirsutum]|uniref:Protein MAIN-LIKE 1-like n=1 Tax=Gossypium hirsutum TaxID=3635 RepID=A0A1U8MIE4_GOSHI|nr:protein MAIN-LIKE 1-like [Gossypium hirsutum]